MDKKLTVQHWVDTLPTSHPDQSQQAPSQPSSPVLMPSPRSRNPRLGYLRDYSQQSLQSDDGGSFCSSVESVLEQRKPDPEEVLLGLGFGPPRSTDVVSRIPSRFLQPSKVLPQIDIDEFLKQHGMARDSEQSLPSSPASRFRPRPN